MLLDAQNLFSDNQKITQGTIYSTNVVRFGLGDVSYVPLLVQVVEDFSDAESITLKVQTSADEDFTNAVDLAQSTLELTSLTQGAKFPLNYLPSGNLGYIRLVYIVNGSVNETTGALTAGVVAAN